MTKILFQALHKVFVKGKIINILLKLDYYILHIYQQKIIANKLNYTL
jgi:hypothetical protein